MNFPNRDILFKQYWKAWVIFIIALAITFFLWLQIRNDLIDSANVSFNFDVEEVKFAIKTRMESYEQILKGGAALFHVKENLTRSDFHGYVEDLQIEKYFPGIQGIGYAKVIQPSELQAHINKIRKEGFPDYKVWPEGKRDVYTSIIYLEPFTDRNLRAFGYDMFSEPNRHEAMTLARDSAEPYASGKVYLVQETDTDVQSGFLVYTPVYKHDADISTVEQRRKAILGYVYSPFRMYDLMRGILGSQRPNLSIDLYDGDSVTTTSMMYSNNSGQINKQPLFTYTGPVTSANSRWTVVFKTTRAFEDGVDIQKSWMVLIGGIIISILLLMLSISYQHARSVFRNIQEILTAAGEGIYGLDKDGHCMFVNDAGLEMIGYTENEVLNSNMHELIHYKRADGTPCPVSECPAFSSMNLGKKIIADNEVFWRKDGSVFDVQFTANPIFSKGEIKGTVVAFNDVTNRKKSEAQIKASLKEKEVLLKEIHHRVKNNMQVISSLLNLQYQYMNHSDPETVNAFQESQDRIRSMALIHEKLYQTENLTNINFSEYVRDLVTRLYNTYRSDAGNVDITVNAPAVDLNMDTSISLGLVLNELVSNVFKHAFPGRQNNKLEVTIKSDTTVHELVVADNGKGFPENIDFQNTESLGLQLVNTLITQIEGTISLEKNNGTIFTIRFPGVK